MSFLMIFWVFNCSRTRIWAVLRRNWLLRSFLWASSPCPGTRQGTRTSLQTSWGPSSFNLFTQLKREYSSLPFWHRCQIMAEMATLKNGLKLFLDLTELSFAAAISEKVPEDESLFDKNVKGFENLSFDWALALSKYIIFCLKNDWLLW